MDFVTSCSRDRKGEIRPGISGSATLLALFTLLFALSCSSAPPTYGAACGDGMPCAGGLLCVSAFPSGYCSSRCGGGAACAVGGVCDLALADGLCLAGCTDASECRAGYQCWRGGCRPLCTIAADCGSEGALCVDGSCMGAECAVPEDCGPGRTCAGGLCVMAEIDAGMPDVPPRDGGTIPNGGACTASGECISGLCLPASRGGLCTEPCTDATGCFDAVDFSAACAPVTFPEGVRTVCVPFDPAGLAGGAACAGDAACASGLCADGLCSEACDDAADCTAGETCGPHSWSGGTFTGCGFPARAGAVETLELDLGTHDIPAMGGSTGLAFGVPADTISATLRAQRVGGSALELVFYAVAAPSGDSIYSLMGFSDLVDQPIRWYPGDGTEAIAMLVPNTTADRFAFQIGRYPFTVAAYGPSGSVSVHYTVLVKRAAAPVSAGQLDLALHLVGVGLTAATAPTNGRVMAMLGRMGTILSRIGVTLGTVTYHDVGSAEATRLAVIDSTDGPTSELAELFRLSSGLSGSTLPLFLVRGVNAGGDGFNTLGIAGGIPGTSGLYGTMNSGVVVAFDPGVVGAGMAGGVVAGHVAAHECSHFLGLYHVTERLRACGPGETPSTAMCVPFGSTDVISDTTRGDTTNLMNWSIVGSGSNDVLSAGQGFVILRSPLTH